MSLVGTSKMSESSTSKGQEKARVREEKQRVREEKEQIKREEKQRLREEKERLREEKERLKMLKEKRPIGRPRLQLTEEERFKRSQDKAVAYYIENRDKILEYNKERIYNRSITHQVGRPRKVFVQ